MAEVKLFNLEYKSNCSKNYQKLVHLPGFALLESSDKINARYDILSAYPYKLLSVDASQSTSLSIFDELQQQIPKIQTTLDLPFQGGAIGYFSYDLAEESRAITSIRQPTLKGLPLAVIGLYDWALIVDHQLKKITLYAGNTQSETSDIVEEVLLRWQSSERETKPFDLSEPFAPLLSKQDYQAAFNAIYQDLCQGRAYQVNFTQPFVAPYEGDTWTMYRQVLAGNPVPFSSFLRTSEGDILSFSPERFVKMENNHLLTSPIKGTEKRSLDPVEDKRLQEKLANCSKNKAENVMIVDLLRNDLGKIAYPGSVEVQKLCQVESYQCVHHLVSHISAHCLETVSPLQAFGSCFPGGSITGAPKLEAMQIIAEQEAFARGVYCGSIGYFSRHGRFDTNIAIRTIVARHGTLHMAAGGGIVIDSKWEEEYVECFTKLAAIVHGFT